MSTPLPHDDPPSQAPAWRPSRRTLLFAGIAFATGLLLFALLWWSNRDNDFYRPQEAVQAEQGQEFEPLPEPLPASAENDNASGMGESPPAAAPTGARIVESPSPAAPPAAAPAPPRDGIAAGPGSTPVPVTSPAPRYPADALRRGESGTVLLRVHVGPDGIPFQVDLMQSSRSRSLDRAASDAVRRWRFRPAQRNGQPVAAAVQVPISFNADR